MRQTIITIIIALKPLSTHGNSWVRRQLLMFHKKGGSTKESARNES